MGLDADSFDKRSLSSLHSQHSLQNLRMQVLKKSTSYDADTSFRAYNEEREARLWVGTGHRLPLLKKKKRGRQHQGKKNADGPTRWVIKLIENDWNDNKDAKHFMQRERW